MHAYFIVYCENLTRFRGVLYHGWHCTHCDRNNRCSHSVLRNRTRFFLSLSLSLSSPHPRVNQNFTEVRRVNYGNADPFVVIWIIVSKGLRIVVGWTRSMLSNKTCSRIFSHLTGYRPWFPNPWECRYTQHEPLTAAFRRISVIYSSLQFMAFVDIRVRNGQKKKLNYCNFFYFVYYLSCDNW